MRMNALQVAQNVKMEGCCFQAFSSTFTEALKMTVGCFKFSLAQFRFASKQLAGRIYVTGHEDAEGSLQAFEGALVEFRQFRSTFGVKTGTGVLFS